MAGQSNYQDPGVERQPRRTQLSILLVLALIAVASLATLAIYKSVPVNERQAAAPNENAQAIRDLQTSQQQIRDQLKAVQQTVASDQAEMKRLSEEITSLNAKLETLQQSFASARQAPVAQPTEPARRKRPDR
jgi:peptidoglycan hydrolase CwlO-like protein